MTSNTDETYTEELHLLPSEKVGMFIKGKKLVLADIHREESREREAVKARDKKKLREAVQN